MQTVPKAGAAGREEGLVQQEGSTGGAQPMPAPRQHLWLRGRGPHAGLWEEPAG